MALTTASPAPQPAARTAALCAGLMLLGGGLAGLSVAFPIGAVVVPLCLGGLAWLQQRRAAGATLWLFLWFFAHLCASLSWMVWALNSPHPWSFTWAVLLLMVGFAAHAAIYCLVYLGLRGLWRLGSRRARDQSAPVHITPRGSAALLGLTVCLADIVRTQSELGLAWAFIGYSQVDNPLLRGYFPVLGIYGVSGLLAWVAALGALALQGWLSARRTPGAQARIARRNDTVVPLVLCTAVLAGSLALAPVRWTQPVATRLPVRTVHTDMLDAFKYTPRAQQASQELLLDLAARPDAAFTLYPELFMVSPAYAYPREWRQALVAAVARSGNQQLVGMPDALFDAQGKLVGMSNAVVQLGPSGAVARRPKEKLIPFAEQGRFGSGRWLSPLLSMFTPFPNSNFQPAGIGDTTPLRVKGVAMSVSICSEIVNPMVFHARGQEAQLMLSASSESWIVSATLSGLLLQSVKARVLEAQKPMLRAANVGVSGYVSETAAIQPGTTLHTLFMAEPRTGNTPFTLGMAWFYQQLQ